MRNENTNSSVEPYPLIQALGEILSQNNDRKSDDFSKSRATGATILIQTAKFALSCFEENFIPLRNQPQTVSTNFGNTDCRIK